jgi:hypothetical protein
VYRLRSASSSIDDGLDRAHARPMSDDFGSGDGGLDGDGGLRINGFANADAHLRTVDAQRPGPHENPADRSAQWLTKVVGAIVLILFFAWAIRVALLS